MKIGAFGGEEQLQDVPILVAFNGTASYFRWGFEIPAHQSREGQNFWVEEKEKSVVRASKEGIKGKHKRPFADITDMRSLEDGALLMKAKSNVLIIVPPGMGFAEQACRDQ